jgi:hypothetical protein
MIREVLSEALEHPWRTLAEALALVACVAAWCALAVALWGAMP